MLFRMPFFLQWNTKYLIVFVHRFLTLLTFSQPSKYLLLCSKRRLNDVWVSKLLQNFHFLVNYSLKTEHYSILKDYNSIPYSLVVIYLKGNMVPTLKPNVNKSIKQCKSMQSGW